MGADQSVKMLRKRIGALERDLERLGAALTSGRLWLWEVDRDFAITWTSPQVAALVGLKPREVMGRKFFDLIPTGEAARVKTLVRSWAREPHTERQLIATALTRDGRSVVLESTLLPLLTARGRCRGFRGTTRDITRRAATEEELRVSRAWLTTIIENLPFDVFVIDKEGRYVLENSACRVRWGEILGRRPEDAAPDPATAAIWIENNARAFAGEVVKGEVEFTVNGEKLSFYNIIGPVWDQGIIRAIIGVNIDITERKRVEEEKRRLEEQFHHSQRLECVGTLAAGLAHDFNNLLTGIQGNVSMLMLDADRAESQYRYLESIEHFVQSGAELTRHLLGLARGGSFVARPVNCNDLVVESATMFGRARKGIRVHTRLVSDCLQALGDRTQVEQVLVNLYLNAWQAMPRGGDLTIETTNVVLDAAFGEPHGVGPGSYVRITVSDTGVGIDPAIVHRIFDPFFTTKKRGRGTGLGLASAYGIVKKHRGIITVASRKGHGTKFSIYLPATEKAAGAKGPGAPPSVRTRRRAR